MTEADLTSEFIAALHKPPSLLPIARHRDNLLYAIEKYPVVIVVGQWLELLAWHLSVCSALEFV